MIWSFGNLSDTNTWTGTNTFNGPVNFNGTVTGISGGLVAGTSPITGSCSNGNVLYDNSGVLGCESFSGSNISALLGGTPQLVFNVADYGAKCDGVTDDTTAINNAVAAWKTAGITNGAVLEGPAKGNSCLVTGSLNFTDTLGYATVNYTVRDLSLIGAFNSGLPIGTLKITAGGSSYTNGTYSNVALTGGSGSGCTASSIVVSGGAVTSITLPANGCGNGYKYNDTGLSAASSSIGGTGSGFTASVGNVSGGAVIDAIGSRWIRWDNVNILGSCTTIPNAGIAIGRYNTNSADYNEFVGLRVSGCFRFTNVYNAQSETSAFYHPYLNNANTGNIDFALVQDGDNHWNWYSSFQTITNNPGTAVSFNENAFYSATFQVSSSTGVPIWMSYASRHRYYASYAASLNYCAEIFQTTGAAATIALYFDTHCETTSMTDIFFIDAATTQNVQINGLTYIDQNSQASNSVFKLGTNVSQAGLLNLDVEIGYFANGNGVKLFDNASLWGSVFIKRIELPNTGNWTVPAGFFGGGSLSFGGPTAIVPGVFSAALIPVPTCNSSTAGSMVYATDITTYTFNATYVSGGSNKGLLVCNGTNWTAH